MSKIVHMLREPGALTPDGHFQAPSSTRVEVDPPEPFKLTQRLKPDVIDQIIACYQAGEPSTAIATSFNISKGSVIRLVRNAAAAIRKQGLTQEQVEEAIKLYVDGKSLAWIGKHLRVDRGTVWRQLRKRGVKMRDSHRRER
jgi:transposase-like protein